MSKIECNPLCRSRLITSCGEEFQKNGRLLEIMEKTAKFFQELLLSPEGASARAYLARRNITPEVASRFELGWSKSSRDATWRMLETGDVSEQDALDVGLVLQGQQGLYDRFRGRIIFPIRDVSGRFVAFGGRIVDGEGAKYINSPVGVLYSKRHNLYLLAQAKSTIREKGRAIFVEGYMDALRLHVHGYTETVASLGAVMTEEHAKLLKRFGDLCYICYDNDMAGQEGTLRGMYTLQNFGLDVYVVSLPTCQDPDELLSSEGGKELFEAALSTARPLLLHQLHIVHSQLENPIMRRTAVDSLWNGLLQVPPTMIAPYVPQFTEALKIPPQQFWYELEFMRNRQAAQDTPR